MWIWAIVCAVLIIAGAGGYMACGEWGKPGLAKACRAIALFGFGGLVGILLAILT